MWRAVYYIFAFRDVQIIIFTPSLLSKELVEGHLVLVKYEKNVCFLNHLNNKKRSYGTSVVINKSWFWNTIECWENYPMQELTPDVQKYYFLGCGHALSLCLTLLTDNVRKDFKAKIVHHAATLSLLVFSYVCGYTRVGALGKQF